jgi:hypothetical protein
MAKEDSATQHSRQFNGWNSVRLEVDQLVRESSEPFDPDTIANAHDLLAVCQNECPLPLGVTKGYWSTVCLSWDKFEIEIFEDRLEVYRFPDQRIDIWYEEHKPGETFSPRFLAELASLSAGGPPKL